MVSSGLNAFLSTLPSGDTTPENNTDTQPAISEGLQGFLDSLSQPVPEDTLGVTLGKTAQNMMTSVKGLGGVAERLYGELPAALGEIQQSAAPSSDDSFLQKYFVKPIKREFATEATLLNPASYTSVAERGKLSKEGQTTQEEANAQLRTNQPNVPEGGAKYYINQLGQMVPVVAGATAAGLAGGPEAAAAVFGAAGGLETYGEQREAGRTPGESLAPTAISATANTALGMLPIHAFLAEGPSMVGKVTKGAITGIAANDLITTIQQGVNKETIDPNMTFDQFVHSLKDPTVIGALVGGLGGAAGRLITGPNQEIINKTAINDVGKSSTTEATPAPFLIDPNNPDRLLSYSDWSMQKNGDVPAYLRKPSTEEISSIPPIPQSTAEDLNVPTYLRKENPSIEPPAEITTQPSFPSEDTTIPAYLRKGVDISTGDKEPNLIKEKVPVEQSLGLIGNELPREELSTTLTSIEKGEIKDIKPEVLQHLEERNIIYPTTDPKTLELTPFGKRLSSELKENPVPIETARVPEPETRISEQLATTKEQQAPVIAPEHEAPFSIAPTTEPRDITQLGKIKQDVISAAQRINPKVDVRFAEQLLGEGPALIRSGAETSARQEVAGSYDKLNNLIDISTNLKKFDPTDTAHHELFHSIEGLLTPEEQTALTTQYPGTDRLSPDEHKATAFADWARGKMANTPMGIRRIFSKVADVFKNLGNVFRRNKVQSADDVFQKVFSGDVGKRAIEAINNADSSTLRNAHPELLQQAAQNSKAPELADIMNTPLSPSDTQALQKIATENSGTPTEKVYSIGHDINTGEISDPEETREKIVHATKAALAQVASPEYVNKVYGEQEAALHALNEEAAEDIFKQKTAGQQAVQAINHVGRGILQSNDGNLRWLAKAKNSETVRKIANMFLANPGANEHNVETFHEERSRIMTDGYNTIYKAIEKIPENEHHRVTYFMQHPEEWEHNLYDPAVHAASKIARFVDLTRQEFTKLGVPVNETKGFFPRVYKTADILANPKAFRKDAFKAYSEALQDEIAKPGMSQQDINAAIHDRIDKWIDNIALQHMGLSSKANDFQVFTSAPTAPNSLRSRVFEKAADDILRKWLVQDPTEAMSGYVYQASRAIPWERRFGGNKWTDMKQAMINEGLDGTDINAVTKIIKSNTGQLGEPLGQAGKTVTSAVRTLASLAYLSHVTFKHLSYPIYMGIRTGNLGNVLRGFSSSTKAMLNTQWGTVSPKMEILKGKMELASLMGEASERAFLDANMGATPQDMLTSINKKWYDNIGITHLMQSMKLAAADTTQYTIAKLAKDVATNSSLKKSAQTLLRGMGVPDEHMENFAHWVTSEKDSIPAQAWESSQDPNAELYRLAMRRGLDQTIVNPNPATAQLWASHPVAGMAYSLSRFMMGLTKQLVVPVLKQGREALQPGYTLGDRARLAAPLMMMPLMTAFTYGYNAIMDDLEPTDKDVYHPAEKRTTAQQLSRALFESEMFAQGSKPMHELAYMLGNAINPKATAKTIDKPFSSSTLGPIAQLLEREGKMVGNIPDLYKKTGNIPKDNMAQRQELTATYNLVVKPALSGAISTLTPEVARPLAFMAIQAVNSPQARRGFVNEFARKKVR